ncbi:MAG: M28 family peptidase [Planctomycetes bacterium]|nr:M28 family peptidase [Planctomycetota bacterium]
MAQVAVQYYANPQALLTAQPSIPPDPSQVGLSVVGNQIIIDPAVSYNGQFTVNVTASDGVSSVSDSFDIEVVNIMALSGATTALSYVEGSGGRTIDPTMSIFNKVMVIDAVNAESDAQYTAYQQTLEAFGSRYYGSQANINAQNYIFNQFASMGLTTTIQGPYGNVVGELRGSDTPNTVYIVGAHFDSVAAGPGGDDNASGTAGVLEAARILSQKQLGATVRFIAFNAEENGLYGSANYVANKPVGETWAGMVSLDMILRPYDSQNPSAPLDLDLATKNSTDSLDWANVFRNAAATYVKTLNVDPVTNTGGIWNYSDNAPFASNNVSPSFLAIENIGGGSNPLYHTPSDIHTSPIAMFNYAFAGDVTQTSIAAFAQSARIGSNTVLAGATVSITNYAAGQDFLSFAAQGGIAGSFDALTGALSLTGSATASAYQSVLQSVAYANTSSNPNTAARTASFKVNDGSFDSNVFTRNINVIAV